MLSDLLVATPNTLASDGPGSKSDAKDLSTDPAAAQAAGIFGVLLLAQLPPQSDPATTANDVQGVTGPGSINAGVAASSTAADWHALLTGTGTNASVGATGIDSGATGTSAKDAGACSDVVTGTPTDAAKAAPAPSALALNQTAAQALSTSALNQTAAQAPINQAAAQAPAATPPQGSQAATTPAAAAPKPTSGGRIQADLAKSFNALKENTKTTNSATPPDLGVTALLQGDAKTARPELTTTGTVTSVKNDISGINAPLALQPSLAAPSAVPADTSARLDATVGTSAWGDQLANHVGYMIQSKTQTASISVNPPDLGPVNIQIKIEANQATLAFVAPHADVRHALENAMPKLKEMLASSGITLGQATVSGDTLPQQRSFADSSAYSSRQFNDNASAATSAQTALGAAGASNGSAGAASGRGLIDIFA